MVDFLCFQGIEGHGKAWADPFLWVRASARTVFDLNIDLDCHYNYSLQREAASLKSLIHGGAGNHSEDISASHQPGTVLTVAANEGMEKL